MSEWTKEPPTEPGFYFWRSHSKANLWCHCIDEPVIGCMEVTFMGRIHTADSLGGEWWPEPIQEPPMTTPRNKQEQR